MRVVQTDRYTLYCGDCLDVLRDLPAGSVDAVITDPPYCSGGYLEAQKNTPAQGLRGSTVSSDDFRWFANDNMSTGGLVFLLRSVMVEVRRLLRQNRSALAFTDWRMVQHLAPALESAGLRWRNMIVWDKGNAGLGVGFKPAYEIILEFSNGSTDYQTNTGQNLVRIPRVHSSQKDHGAQKPIELMVQLAEVIAAPRSLVLDPFMGSGTTGVACMQTGRRFIGVEIDPGYFEIAKRRIEDAAAQLPLIPHEQEPQPRQEGLL